MDPSGQSGVNAQQAVRPQLDHEVVEVTVSYLPSPNRFQRKYGDETTVGTIRTDAMAFFGVQDHKDRDTHEFFLEFEGRRLTNIGEALGQLLGPHRREAHFNLVEQVTQGTKPR
jgi:hypothetical protein